jgi:hypothetical protein
MQNEVETSWFVVGTGMALLSIAERVAAVYDDRSNVRHAAECTPRCAMLSSE